MHLLLQVAGVELGRNSAVEEAEMAKAKQAHTARQHRLKSFGQHEADNIPVCFADCGMMLPCVDLYSSAAKERTMIASQNSCWIDVGLGQDI